MLSQNNGRSHENVYRISNVREFKKTTYHLIYTCCATLFHVVAELSSIAERNPSCGHSMLLKWKKIVSVCDIKPSDVFLPLGPGKLR